MFHSNRQGRYSLQDKFISLFSSLLTILGKRQNFSVYLSFPGQWNELFKHVMDQQGLSHMTVLDFSDGPSLIPGFKVSVFPCVQFIFLVIVGSGLFGPFRNL